MRNDVSLRHMRYFVAVAEERNFRAAAQRLHITQPALSRSIKALEEELGHPLFDRIGRRIEITSFGLPLLEHVRSLVDLADTLRQNTQQARQGLLVRMAHKGLREFLV